MANGKVLRQLIKAGSAGDKAAFRKISEAVIMEERQKQHHLLANDLESILYADQVGMVKKISKQERSLSLEIPSDKEKGFPLLTIKQPVRSIEELIVNDKSSESLNDILEENRRSDLLKSFGVQPSKKVIFYGPPGCGKTMAAEIMAYELDVPLALVRLDSLVSSFLGETAGNLRQVFEFISNNKMVVLFDEFDAIGKSRDDSDEHGELKRVVNAVLQMMDEYSGASLIVAATNYERILDRAIWRRFDESISFPLPSREQIIRILTAKLRGVRRQFDIESPEILDEFIGASGADIERVVRRAVKKVILRGKEFITEKDIHMAVSREGRPWSESNKK